MTIQQALETIHQKIQDATQLAHRPESAVTLLAVSKNTLLHPDPFCL